MFSNYNSQWQQYWNSRNITQKSQGLPVDSEAIKQIQAGGMVDFVVTLVAAGQKDVGVLYKPTGNNYLYRGKPIATDIICIRETDNAGNVIGNTYQVIDCIISGMNPAARPAWQNAGTSDNIPNYIPGAELVPPVDPEPPDPNPQPPSDFESQVLDKMDQIIDILSGIRDGMN